MHSRTPLAVTQHLPVAGDVLSRIVKVAREVDEAELGKRLLLLPPRKLSEEKGGRRGGVAVGGSGCVVLDFVAFGRGGALQDSVGGRV